MRAIPSIGASQPRWEGPLIDRLPEAVKVERPFLGSSGTIWIASVPANSAGIASPGGLISMCHAGRSRPPHAESSMRITLVTETYFPQVNGVSRTLRELVRHLTACGDAVQLVHPDYGEAV